MPNPSTLVTSLQSYWKMDEQGTAQRRDSHSTSHLNASGNCAAILGKVRKWGPQSETFGSGLVVGPATSGFLHRDDDANLSMGDIQFRIACWVMITQKDRSSYAIAGKWNTTGNNREYLLDYSISDDRFRFRVSSNGTAVVTVLANNLGSPSLNTWYFIVAGHDSAANNISISVNNGTANSTATSAGVVNGTSPFRVGRAFDGSERRLAGRVDGLGVWKKNLSANEITELYNAGFAKEYPWGTMEDIRSIKPAGGGDYTTLHSWYTAEARSLIVPDVIMVGKVYSGGNAGNNTNLAVGTSLTTDRTHWIEIRAAEGHAHDGTGRPYTTSKAYMDITALNASIVTVTNVIEFRTSKMQYIRTATTPTVTHNMFFVNNGAGATTAQTIIDKCVFVNDVAGTPGGAACTLVSVNNGGTSTEAGAIQNHVLKNCLLVNRSAGANAAGFLQTGTTTTKVHNNTVIALGANTHALRINSAAGNIDSRNNYLRRDGTGSCYSVAGGGGTISKGGGDSTNNAEALHRKHRNIPYSTVSFESVTANAENLHILFNSSGLFRMGDNSTQQAFKVGNEEFLCLTDWEDDVRLDASGLLKPPTGSGNRIDVGCDQVMFGQDGTVGGYCYGRGFIGPSGILGGYCYSEGHSGPSGILGGYCFCMGHTGPSGILGGYLTGFASISGTLGGYIPGVAASSGGAVISLSGYLGGYLFSKTIPGFENNGIVGGYLNCDSPNPAGQIGGYLLAMTLADPSGYLGGIAYGLRQPTDASLGGYMLAYPDSKEFVEARARALIKARSSAVPDQDLNLDCVVIFKGIDNKDFNAQFIWYGSAAAEFNARFRVEKYKRPPIAAILSVSPPSGIPITSCINVTVTASGTLQDGHEWNNAQIYFCDPFRSTNPRSYNHNMSVSGFNTPPPWTANHVYCKKGIYHITVRAQDDLGMVGMETYRLNLASGYESLLAKVSISGVPRSGSVPNSVKVDLTSQSLGVPAPPFTNIQRSKTFMTRPSDIRGLWMFGNMEVSQKTSPWTYYSAPGRYVVTLAYMYQNPSGNDSIVVSDTLRLNYNR